MNLSLPFFFFSLFRALKNAQAKLKAQQQAQADVSWWMLMMRHSLLWLFVPSSGVDSLMFIIIS